MYMQPQYTDKVRCGLSAVIIINVEYKGQIAVILTVYGTIINSFTDQRNLSHQRNLKSEPAARIYT